MEMLAIIGYRGVPSKEKLDTRLSIVKYVSVLEWSLFLEWVFKWNTYNIQIWNTYEISKLNTGSKFWAFDFFSLSFFLVWVFPTMFFLKKKSCPPWYLDHWEGIWSWWRGYFPEFLERNRILPPPSIPRRTLAGDFLRKLLMQNMKMV